MTARLRPHVLAALITVGSPVQAWAHAHLTSAVPATGSEVATAPAELDLGFSEGVDPTFTGVRVTGPGGAAVTTGETRPGPGGVKAVVVPLPPGLGAGPYRVDWHALAADGHRTTGTYSFTVAP